MRLIFFGSGYCSTFIIPLVGNDLEVICTHKNKIKVQAFDKNIQIKRMLFDEFFDNSPELLNTSSIIINSIPPINERDILAEKLKGIIKKKNSIKWYGYLSSTGVYGDQGGKWVTEDTMPKPQTKGGIARLKAEKQNMSLLKEYNLPVHIFRLPGIYGPGRSICEKIKKNQFIIKKEDHYFSRVHVKDIAYAIQASIDNPTPGEIFNLTDDLPERNDLVADYAAKLMNIKLEKIGITDKRIGQKVLDFYKDNKKVSNTKIKNTLSWSPKFKNYKLGISEILKRSNE